jgi:hypothetical protein
VSLKDIFGEDVKDLYQQVMESDMKPELKQQMQELRDFMIERSREAFAKMDETEKPKDKEIER